MISKQRRMEIEAALNMVRNMLEATEISIEISEGANKDGKHYLIVSDGKFNERFAILQGGNENV